MCAFGVSLPISIGDNKPALTLLVAFSASRETRSFISIATITMAGEWTSPTFEEDGLWLTELSEAASVNLETVSSDNPSVPCLLLTVLKAVQEVSQGPAWRGAVEEVRPGERLE